MNTPLTHSFLFSQHPFVSQPLSRTLAIELLDKASNPDHSTYNDFDDDDPEPEVTFDLLWLVTSVFKENKTTMIYLLLAPSFLSHLPIYSSLYLPLPIQP